MAEAERRQVALNNLVKWCERKGSKEFFIKGNGLRAVVDKTSGVQIIAIADIPAKTLLLSVPPSLAFTAFSATHASRLIPEYVSLENQLRLMSTEQAPAPSFFPDGSRGPSLGHGALVTKDVESQIKEHQLALALCLELASYDRGCNWQVWLETLPESVNHLPLWSFNETDLDLCKGTYLHDLILAGREDHKQIMQRVIKPILDRIQGGDDGYFKYQDLKKHFQRALALVFSRAFDDIKAMSQPPAPSSEEEAGLGEKEGGQGVIAILPVIDCLNGEVEGGGNNAIMFGRSQVFSNRPIHRGEEILLSYGTKDNNTFLLSYGHLSDRMIFGNPHHKVCLSLKYLFPLSNEFGDETLRRLKIDFLNSDEFGDETLRRLKVDFLRSLKHLLPLSDEFGDETLRRLKIDFLNRYCALAHWQSSFWSNLWMPPDTPEGEARKVIPPPLRLFALLLAIRDLPALQAIESSGQFEVDETTCDMALAGRVMLGAVDLLLGRMTKTTIAEDLKRLEGYEEGEQLPKGGLTPTQAQALRITVSDKALLVRARREICRELDLPNDRDDEVWLKICGTCSTSRQVKRCAHCGKAWYCSRSCQRADWKLHKKQFAAAAEGVKVIDE